MAQVSDHYDGSAPSYHEQYDPEKIWTNAEYPANYFRLNKVMQILKSRNVASVYELGAAEGSPIVRIAQELGVNVRASDLSSEMVRLGKENFQRNGLDPVGDTSKGVLWRVADEVAPRAAAPAWVAQIAVVVGAAQLLVVVIALLLALPTAASRRGARRTSRIVGPYWQEGT